MSEYKPNDFILLTSFEDFIVQNRNNGLNSAAEMIIKKLWSKNDGAQNKN